MKHVFTLLAFALMSSGIAQSDCPENHIESGFSDFPEFSLTTSMKKVPGEYPSISEALSDANNGDTVAVSPGTYFEHDLNFNGKDIVLYGIGGSDGCIIDGQNVSRIFDVTSGETLGAQIIGFTLQNGQHATGSAIRLIQNSMLTVRHCKFLNNIAPGIWTRACLTIGHAYNNGPQTPAAIHLQDCIFENNDGYYGGAIMDASIGDFQSLIERCVFRNNSAFHGSAIFGTANTVIRRCLFYANSANGPVNSTIDNGAGTPIIENCTFLLSDDFAIARTLSNSVTQFKNCIFQDIPGAVNLGNSETDVEYYDFSFCSFDEGDQFGANTVSGPLALLGEQCLFAPALGSEAIDAGDPSMFDEDGTVVDLGWISVSQAPIPGCTDPEACNYSAEATFEDGSCFLPGCMDISACNFDEAATCPSDDCIYFPVVDLGEDLMPCEESFVLAAGNEGASYLWSNGETTSEIDVTQSGEYSVEVSVSSGLPADAAAIDGFQHIGSFEQSHYYVSEASILWEEAKINCELLGGHLVTISSEEENELVWQGVYANGLNPGGSNNYQAWIGLYQNFDSPDYSEPAGGWEWVTGEPVVYSNWAPEEPNNNDQGYFVHMTDANGACTEGDDICGTWDDANISGNLQSAFYVLELPIVSTLCTSSDSVVVEFNHGSCFCGANAVWDESLGECVGEISPSSACGPGTYWDEEGKECIILMPSDTDFDGCVSMVDLLDLLTVFGTCVEVPWACGDPLEYQGYDYETVQIGEQCWFAENLRSENYANGDAILGDLNSEEWAETTLGASSVYDNDDSFTSIYGLHYNGYAVFDERGLCPAGWKISSWEEFYVLADHVGGQEVGCIPLKATSGWTISPVDLNGTDEYGFAGLPCGYRNASGEYSVVHSGYWSSSVQGTSGVWNWGLGEHEYIYIGYGSMNAGLSVRCLQDAE